MKKAKDIIYVGVDDTTLDLFEGQYVVPEGMSYNSYVIMDEKVAVMDAVDKAKIAEWLGNIEDALAGRQPDYLVISHMEPDHSAGVAAFAAKYPEVTVVGNAKIFDMFRNFYGAELPNKLLVKEGDKLSLGEHELTFCSAPRYYFNIVGKYGVQVQALLKKLAGLDIAVICPLHGPVLDGDLAPYLSLYDTWSKYEAESKGTFIAYAGVYGNTKEAAYALKEELESRGEKAVITDLARCDLAEALEDAFRYDKTVFAATTLDGGIFPVMEEFIRHLTAKNYQNRKVGIIENGSWAPMSGKLMRALLEEQKNVTVMPTFITCRSSVPANISELCAALADELLAD